MNIQDIKQRFGIIGNSPLLDRAIEIASQVAFTDLSVLITGESGSGKEVFPKIIHQNSSRKHGNYIAVNCGAIPKGTIDSELFGHEKGSFTGAHDARKGYFEVADGGTIFLDEVAELPLETQSMLLRVLESGEYIKVGASKVQKTDVRIIAATHVNVADAVRKGKFREDLFYRLNTVPISVPPLRRRPEDIHLLFRKFSADFSEKYRMPPVRLSVDAIQILENYNWPGNVRQLKNITEQISVIEEQRQVDEHKLLNYLPDYTTTTSLTPFNPGDSKDEFSPEKEILYKVLFEMKKDLNDLKKLVVELIQDQPADSETLVDNAQIIKKIIHDVQPESEGEVARALHLPQFTTPPTPSISTIDDSYEIHATEEVEESLSIADREKDLIRKALEKHRGKRKNAARELGISERTLYRKIKEYNLQ